MSSSERIFSTGDIFDIYRAKAIAEEDWDIHISNEICQKYNKLKESSKNEFDQKFAEAVEENKDKFAGVLLDPNTTWNQEILNEIICRVVKKMDDFCKI